MSAGFVETQLSDVWCEHLGITLLAQFLTDKVLQFLSDDRAFRSPEHKALTDFLINMEQTEFTPEFSVIALLRFIELLKVFREFFSSRERRSIKTLKLWLGVIAHIEGAGYRHDFDIFTLA